MVAALLVVASVWWLLPASFSSVPVPEGLRTAGAEPVVGSLTEASPTGKCCNAPVPSRMSAAGAVAGDGDDSVTWK